MATYTWAGAHQFTTDAEFRTWCTGYSTMFSTLGWVQTADTGQINLATVVKPAAQNTMQGYQIWRANDALQSTYPLYLKYQYGSGNGAASFPAFQWQLGTATDGAGTLLGQITTANTMSACGTGSAGPYNNYASGDSSRIVFSAAQNFNQIGAGLLFSVERTRDTSGANTNVGFFGNSFGGSTGSGSTQVSSNATGYAGTTHTNETTFACLGTTAYTTGVVGANINVMTHHPIIGRILPASHNLIHYYDPDITQGTQFSVTINGAARNYLALGNSYVAGGSVPNIRGVAGSTEQCPAILYE